MTIHVFVATTQGLVAVNNLYALPDAVPNSMVTAGGFSEPCPITNSYHNFVKLGSGVIEAEFGKGPYRIDLSEKISQGNSWQLGFYFAHICYYLDLLGDGNPQPGDEIFCATGAIKTADETIVAVDEVPRKIAQASEQLSQWKEECKILFFVPEENKPDISNIDGVNFRTLSHLNDVPMYLPDPAGVMGLVAAAKATPAPDTPTPTAVVKSLQPEDNSLQPEKVSHQPQDNSHQPEKKSQRHWVWLTAAALAVGALATTLYTFDSKQALPVPKASSEPLPAVMVSKESPQLTLSARYSDNCSSGKFDIQPVETVSEYRFAPVQVTDSLCDISAKVSVDTEISLFVGPGSRDVMLRWFQDKRFSVPTPADFKGSKRYFIVTFAKGLNSSEQRKIRGYFFEHGSPGQITRKQLESLVAELGMQANVYENTMTR